jgi:hypothetical protein
MLCSRFHIENTLWFVMNLCFVLLIRRSCSSINDSLFELIFATVFTSMYAFDCVSSREISSKLDCNIINWLITFTLPSLQRCRFASVSSLSLIDATTKRTLWCSYNLFPTFMMDFQLNVETGVSIWGEFRKLPNKMQLMFWNALINFTIKSKSGSYSFNVNNSV